MIVPLKQALFSTGQEDGPWPVASLGSPENGQAVITAKPTRPWLPNFAHAYILIQFLPVYLLPMCDQAQSMQLGQPTLS